METKNELTAYSYKADNSESYYALVEYATTMVAAQKLTLIPSELTMGQCKKAVVKIWSNIVNFAE